MANGTIRIRFSKRCELRTRIKRFLEVMGLTSRFLFGGSLDASTLRMLKSAC